MPGSDSHHEYDDEYGGLDDFDKPPWDIGEPQPALLEALAGHEIGHRVLDAGCGTGELAIELARRGHDVTGIDISSAGIDIAKSKARAAGVAVDFHVGDATEMPGIEGPFDAVVDSGLLHSLDSYDQQHYIARLRSLCRPGADVFVLAVSREGDGPEWGETEQSMRAAFDDSAWSPPKVSQTEVAYNEDGQRHSMPGFLLTTQRT
jgi:ubiquinone/menaquinone biosynthesis C-methylase UbiE